MNRRELFVHLRDGAIAAASVMVVGACGSDGNQPIDGPPDCLANGTRSSIGGNHGHMLTVTIVDIQAAQDHTYDITGYADHAHDVSLSAGDYATLAGNGPVMTTSSVTLGHSHPITIRCN